MGAVLGDVHRNSIDVGDLGPKNRSGIAGTQMPPAGATTGSIVLPDPLPKRYCWQPKICASAVKALDEATLGMGKIILLGNKREAPHGFANTSSRC